MANHSPQSLTDYFADQEKHPPHAVCCHFMRGTECETITYAQLFAKAGQYATLYRKQGLEAGQVVLILLPHCADLLYAFSGAILAGCIPAFIAPLSEKQVPEFYWDSIRHMLDELEISAIVVTPTEWKTFDGSLDVRAHKLINPGDAASLPTTDFAWHRADPRDVAFLQFSSGTTGYRKGVMLTHAQVVSQLQALQQTLAFGPRDVIVSWLPLYHDMGLIACFVTPVALGIPLVMMSPFEWVREPHLLFESIERYRGTHVWLPNFAFNHLAAAIGEDWRFDLSSVRAFINCSEPCKPRTFAIFADRFAAMGVSAAMLQTCYAMAEAVFAVTHTQPGVRANTLAVDMDELARNRRVSPARDGTEAGEYLSVGRCLPGFEIRISGEGGAALPEDRVGRITIRGPSLSDGYYRNREAMERAFAGGWYDSGDLGFVHDGELYVTGREKDLIIVNGRNFHAHDVEAVVNEVDGVKKGRNVAFGVYDPNKGSEDLILLLEQGELDPAARKSLLRSIKNAVLERLNVSVYRVELVPPKWLIKTTSGKIDRVANRARYLHVADGNTI